MKHVFFMLFIASACVVATSCSKPKEQKDAILEVSMKHHLVAHSLVNCKVYIKYNTQDKPANGKYDDSAAAIGGVLLDTMQTATFTHLANGNYYIYGTGWDTSINQAVKGGAPYIIKQQTTQSFDLPVSEN